MIEFSDVSVSKTRRKLFQNFSFRILPGENWVIQGNNGSGKTLFLQLAAGALHPVSGSIHHSFIKGDDWDTLYRQRQEKIHFVPTHWLESYIGASGGQFYQQRYYSIGDTDLPKVKDVFAEDAEKLKTLRISQNFDIQNLLDLPVTSLSNGQLKKVIILRQLTRSMPRLLLLDYPFDGLDADSRQDFSGFIDDIATKYSIQVLIVDHDEVLPNVINRKLILNNFQIQCIENIRKKSSPKEHFMSIAAATDYKDSHPVVEMKNLTIQYGGRKIIENLNWRINKGERWALTGKNGSGKTTLFSLIYADHPMAYSQEVYLFGKRRGTGESIWDIKNRINYLGPEQVHFLNPKGIMLTAHEYILLQPHKDPYRLNELVDFFLARSYIDVPVRLLSSGQLQLVLLLNMFLDDKELLLLDEPFQFLDPHNHERVTQYLNHYLDSEITLVLITHDEKDVVKWTQKRKQI